MITFLNPVLVLVFALTFGTIHTSKGKSAINTWQYAVCIACMIGVQIVSNLA